MNLGRFSGLGFVLSVSSTRFLRWLHGQFSRACVRLFVSTVSCITSVANRRHSNRLIAWTNKHRPRHSEQSSGILCRHLRVASPLPKRHSCFPALTSVSESFVLHYGNMHFVIIMAALRSRCGHYIFVLWFLLSINLSSSSFSWPNLSRRRWNVYHTSTHGVALVRI